MISTSPQTTKNSSSSRRHVFLYARVSSVAQSDGPSLEEQFIAMEQFARRGRMTIVGRDMDETSAYGPGSELRRGFQSAVRQATKLDAALLVFNVSRLSRWLPTVEVLRAHRLRVYSVDIGYVNGARLRSEVLRAQDQSDAKSRAQKASKALSNRRKPTSTLTNTLRRAGIINNALRSDDNIHAAASHLTSIPGVETLTHEQRAACLNKASVLRLMNTRTGRSKPWDREALRKNWPAIELEMALLREDDPMEI